MSQIMKKVSTDFYLKIDTDYDLFGADGSGFECWYVEDGGLTWTEITNPFIEIIEPISSPSSDTVTNAVVNAGSNYIPVTADPTLVAGDVFMVDGTGTAASATITDSDTGSMVVTMFENLGDGGNITIKLIETGAETTGGASGTWDDATRTLTVDIEDGVTTDDTIRTELLTFTTLIDTVTGNTTSTWDLTAPVTGDSFNATGGADPQIYYVESTNATTDRVYIRGTTTATIPADSTLTQVGNSGVYRVKINIGTVGEYTIICRNDSIGMQNIAQSVNIVAEILSDAIAKIDTIDTVVDGIDTQLDTVEGKIDTVDTVVDGIATDVTTIDGKVDTIDTVVDGIQTDVTTIDGKVDTIDTVVDGIQTDVTTIDGKIDTVDTVVDGIQTDVTAIDGKVDTIDTVVDSIETKVDALTAAQGVSRTYYRGFI